MKTKRGRRSIATHFLQPRYWMRVDFKLHVPAFLAPGKKLSTHWLGDCMGPRGCLDGCRKSHPNRASIPGTTNPKQVAIPTELSRPNFLNITLFQKVKNSNISGGAVTSLFFTELLQRLGQHTASKCNCTPSYIASQPIRLKVQQQRYRKVKSSDMSHLLSALCFASSFG